MGIKVHNILFILLFSLCFAPVIAQDANFPGTETSAESDKETEKLLYSPGELDPAFQRSQTTTFKDSTSTKAQVKVQPQDSPKTPAKQPSQEDDSILSFNFLYYIFQKYKLQDIVD